MYEKEIKTALIVVDLQKEFTDGKLKLPYSSNIVDKVNKVQNKFDVVCFIKNIFPKRENVLEKVTISDSGHYCIEDTDGANFHPDLKTNDNIFIRNYDENFSVMNSKNNNKSLMDFLNENKITHIFISGVPGDYSIKYSAMESIKYFKTYIIIDMIKTINKINNFIKYLIIRKIPFTDTEDLDLLLKGLSSKPGTVIDEKRKTKKEEFSVPSRYGGEFRYERRVI